MNNSEAVKGIKILEDCLEFDSVTDGSAEYDVREICKKAAWALEIIDNLKSHKFLNLPKELFDRLPSYTKGYHLGWNDALDAVRIDYEAREADVPSYSPICGKKVKEAENEND